MKYIPSELSQEIREKYCKLINWKDISEITIKLNNNKLEKISKSSQIHSFRMENPRLRIPFSVPRNKYKKEIKEGMERLREAFYWGVKNFNPKELNEEFIMSLGAYMVPELADENNLLPYRTFGSYTMGGVQISASGITPPDSYKVKNIEMPNFIKELKKNLEAENIICKLKTAIYSHFHLVRIHPFADGNGRTARTMQDIILTLNKLPVPIIPVSERNTYYQLLERAVYDWKHLKKGGEIKNGATEGESLFYTFIAGKVNNSLDKILED